MKQNQKSGRSRLRKIMGLCCFVVFCVSVYMVVSQTIQERRAAEAFEALLAQLEQEEQNAPPEEVTPPEVTEPKPDSSAVDTGPQQEEPPKPELPVVEEFHKYDVLYEQNPDLFGWIAISGTKINYPVMHTPDDPEHYLHRAFDGTYSSSGVPFLDGDCDVGCGNYIVYGHHMKNGSMFAALSDYKNEDFWKEHPVIQFDTLDKAGEYEVLAAFYAKVYRVDDENAFRFYSYTDLTDEDTFNEFVSQVKKASLYDTGVTAGYGDTLLTLTTCSYHTSNGRFVVVAREKAGAESADEPDA